eukprot:257937-Chlamydomonas_euryale.AAC.4
MHFASCSRLVGCCLPVAARPGSVCTRTCVAAVFTMVVMAISARDAGTAHTSSGMRRAGSASTACCRKRAADGGHALPLACACKRNSHTRCRQARRIRTGA